MMNMKQVCLATAASMALCLAANAGGQNAPTYSHEGHHHGSWNHGWYVGAGINADVSNENEQDFGISEWYYYNEITGDETNFELEDNDVGFDIYVGKKVNKHFAFEVGYSMVGDLEFTSFHDVDDGFDHQADIDQWNVRAAGLVYWPVAEYFNVFLKAGAAYISTETDFDTTNSDFEDSIFFAEFELNTFAFLYGVGAEFGVDRWGARVEYTGFEITEANEESFYISDLVGASVFYRFL